MRAAQATHRDLPQVGVLVGELFGGESGGVGYLLKDRVADVGEFVEAGQHGRRRRPGPSQYSSSSSA